MERQSRQPTSRIVRNDNPMIEGFGSTYQLLTHLGELTQTSVEATITDKAKMKEIVRTLTEGLSPDNRNYYRSQLERLFTLRR